MERNSSSNLQIYCNCSLYMCTYQKMHIYIYIYYIILRVDFMRSFCVASVGRINFPPFQVNILFKGISLTQSVMKRKLSTLELFGERVACALNNKNSCPRSLYYLLYILHIYILDSFLKCIPFCASAC